VVVSPRCSIGFAAGMKKEGGGWEVGLWLCKPTTSSRGGIGFTSFFLPGWALSQFPG